jgi:hypothetical protein
MSREAFPINLPFWTALVRLVCMAETGEILKTLNNKKELRRRGKFEIELLEIFIIESFCRLLFCEVERGFSVGKE